jgi:uncharacterized protein
MLLLSLVFGTVVGFSLGLTGGGGSILAVPLLVYGLGIPPHQAVGISLMAVGATACLGMIQRLLNREIEVGIGLLFAGAGMLGAPVGAWAGRYVPAVLLLTLFASLMLFVAARMWIKATKNPEESRVVRASRGNLGKRKAPACRHDPNGKLKITARCTTVMTLVGLMTGVLSGLFGVGGGFVIVPALVLFTTITIHQAVATSLLVITLISSAGVVSFILSGGNMQLDITGFFVVGGGLGMGLGILLSRKISGPLLQKVFAFSIVILAGYMLTKNLL